MRQRILFMAVCMALLSGCMSTGGGNNLSARVDRHDQQLQMLMSQVGQVEQVLPGQAEMWAQMQTMRQELNMINGRLEEAQGGMGGMGGGMGGGEIARLQDKVNRIEAVVRQIASQLAINVDSLNVSYTGAAFGAGDQPGYAPPVNTGAHMSGGAVQPGGQPGNQAGGAPQPPVAIPPGNQAQTLYDAGIRNFDERRYKEAVVSFKDFTAAYPQHKLAGNAHFWEGESYFQMQDYARAALAYQEVIVKHPGSPKLQSSMLKQGMALYHAGKKEAARERLQDLVKRYPNSPETTRAKQFLSANK